MSKIVEKVVAVRFSIHLSDNDLYEQMQSAYRPNHSTETALLSNDLLCILDERKAAILVLLDLSAAFDTIDHTIMLTRLRDRFGITATCLAWFESYLENRSQRIQMHGRLSAERPMVFGVPQGSVLSPLMFICYTAPLGDIARRHGINVHLYADDTQLYLAFSPHSDEDTIQAVTRIQNCVAELQDWMNINKLKFNATKTEIIVMCTPHIKTKLSMSHRELGDTVVPVSTVAKNIGVFFDDALSMNNQVQHICRVAYFYIHCSGKIRNLLDRKTTEIMIHSYVTSRLDNGNCLLYGISDHLLTKLQRAQNAAARLITKTRKHDHITAVLINLHWLPIKQRIEYKLLLLTFRSLHGLAAPYLSDLLIRYQSTRALRSADALLLEVPRCRLRTQGEKTFSSAAPRLWNNLPVAMRATDSLSSFKKQLKTLLFKRAFSL